MSGNRGRFGHLVLLVMLGTLHACNKTKMPDAFGNFEATEVVVSAQTSGQLRIFTPVEGSTLTAGTVVGVVDTTQLDLERAQIATTRATTESRINVAQRQIGVYESQLANAQRNFERMQRLFDQKAATAQQRDQAERDYSTLQAQVAVARAQQQSVSREVASANAQIARIEDRINQSRIANPASGTVLVTYAKPGETVQPGQPLYRIANLDTLVLRAYVVQSQLSSIRLGQAVAVHVDQGKGELLNLTGTVTWISSKAEFTPTPIQTRDERADLVYAVKILVPNTNQALKIGMPADITLADTARRQ